MKQYFLEKGRIFSIRKLTVGVASVAVGLAFFASGNVAASELVTEPKLEVDSQAKEVADVDHEKEEAVKEEVTEKTEPAIEKVAEEGKTAEVAGDILPEEIPDRAYPDTPVKKVDTAAIVSEKDSPQVETKSILKPTEAAPSEGEKENRAIINGGQDLKHINYEGQPATSATMVYSIFSSPLANGGSQRYLNSGSGIFVAPNVILTVAHNFLVKDADTNAGSIRGGDTAKFYYNVGSNTAKNNSLPTSGNTILFKEKDIHFWNKEKFGEGYKNDLALVVAPVPLSIASPNKAATFTPLAEHREYKAGEPVSTIGYPTDSTSPELKEPIVPGQLYKADGVVKGTEKYDDKGTVGVTYRLTSVSGLSGGGIINGEGKVIGIHQRGTVDNANIAEKDRFGGGLVLSPEQLAWVKEIIDKYGVKGWYQGDNGNRYYFTPEGEMLRNKTAVIGENKYSFDESGVATLLEGVDYGRVVVEHLDQNDNPVKENDTFVEKTEVGTQFDYNYKTEIEKTDFFKKNKDKYEIVSIDGKTVNKQLKDAWEDDYSVVSKAPAGTRVIKVVYKVNKGSFDVHYRLKGTDQELATATVDNNEGKEYEVSFVHRFQAKEIAGYRAVNASQEATIQHKGVNEVIFEYEKIEDPKPATPATPVVDPKDEETEIAAYGPLPSKAQLDYHKEELAAFIHYGMNTYTNSEWGNGRENPQNFNPTNLDTDQWIKTLKDAGFKRTIMVVKHHDGFVIYPSKYTDHTVAASPWKDGKGDLLEEISKSATKYDMNMGVYLSPWDANNPKYHVSTEKEYNEYYLNQLKEILGNPKYGNNGKFIEVWMDGARGSGAQKVTYTFDEWFKYIKEAEGDIAIFSAQPTSVRWIGNERGIAGDPVWHKVKKAKITDDVKNEYLNHGDPEGDMYSVGEADVSIRSGWFYHDNQQPKSIKDLMDIYFKSVGRGTPLLLNIPPNKEGKFADADVARLKEFRATLDQMYATDFAKGATVTASSTRKNHLYQASNLTDGKDDTSWALSNDAKTGEFTVDLGQKRRFDVVELKEDIAKGQRISGFKVEVELNGRWVPYGEGSTVGYRRLVQGQPVEAQKIRVTITNSQATPILTNFSVYKTPSSIEKTDGYPLGLDYHSNTTADKANTTWYDESEGVRGTSMWTNQKDASVTYRFNGTKAYVVSTVDPNHGEMSVYVDGQKVADVQTNNAARKRSQMVYETDDLAPGEHTIKLVNKTGKAIATEGIYTLNNAGKGMFELKETTYEVQKGQPVTVTIKRVGGSKGAATVHVVTEPGTGVHGKVYKDTTADLTFQEGETEKTLTIPTIDFTEQADSIFDFKVKMTSASDEALLGFASEATIRVMKAELLQKDQVSHDDQASQLDYSPGWHHETNSSGKYQNTESWASFGRLTEEQKKNASVTAYFYGTGLEIKGFVDPGHGIYKVTLDGRRVEYQDGLGNASEYNGKKYFSGTAATRQGDQTLVRLTGLEEGWHAVTLQLDPKRNDTTRNIGIQVDQFITHGEGSALYTKEELIQAMKNWKDELVKFDQTSLKNTPEARQAFKSNLDKLSEQLSASDAKPQEVLKTAAALQTILDKEENYGVEETPAQPEEPKIDYDKAMASLAEAIQNKTKELGDDKEAKKKLVELSEQALVSIQEAKTQDAVDQALQAALTSINQLQATPKEEPKPEEPAQPEEPKIDYDKAMASLAEAIQNKTKELGDDKEAKKKLVELSEQALVSIQEAKTQDAVDKALQAALTSINQLQATPKEEPKPEEPAQPEEPKIDYDKAMASLAEAIQNKTKELGDDKEAKKKLVELSEQALVSIQEAKTQDAVDKALQAALTSINQLQATPKEEPKPEEPAQPEEPKIDYDKAMASLAEAIQNKTKELGDDKEAKKKLVELSEQALVSIQEAKTQDAVDKALQAALTSINQLQATPKEDPKPEEPAQPEEPKIDYDKAMASLAEAIQNKTKELGDDKEAKKKLVELSEQAIAAIEAAETQDAVDKALQAALTSINQLQATPKEEPKPEEPAQPEEPKIDYDKAMASLAEAIRNKTKELGDDKEAKKKLVELSEQAIAAIEAAKTQDAVDQALQAALTSINQLQATPKEDPKPEEPAQPEEPKIDYDKAMASLAEAIQNKTKELGDDKEAKKKLVELSEQALVSIQEAKTQDAVDKALQAALTSINQLQATPKEEPKPEEPAQPEEPKIDYDKAMASLAEAIQNKTKELGDDKEAKKKLVELSEQAIAAIEAAKTQDAVDQALQAALTSINQLQATPKEEPKPEEPAQPEEPKIDYDKAMASLAEAIQNKTKELGDDKEAKKKLVELSEQAIAAIEAAKTQDAVDKALQAALTSINQLQATPKEEPKPEEPAQPEEPKIDYDKAMASLAEAIQNKTKELGNDKEAKKKLVELSEQALVSIQEAKTQDAVDQALQAALTSINQLQATPKEEPKPEEPAQPEEPKIDYDKAMASLAEAIRNKTKELGNDKEAKKKLVELSEQAIAAIEAAKTQDAVDKALQAALTSINQLQATPKEDPKPEEPAQPEEPKIDYDKAMASLAEAIQNKTKELGNDKEAKKKLVELSEQAIAAIEAAKTQDAVDQALQAALTSINQLQATPKEEVKHSVVPTEGDTVLVQTQPSIEVVEESINFKTVKQEDPTLPEGETRVTQVGRAGKERILTEVAPDGSRITKLREVVEVAQDEIVLVGTKKEESGKTEAAIHEVPEFTGGVNGSEAAIHEVPEFTGGVNGSEAAIHEVPEFTGGVNGSEAAIHEVPEFTGSVNGSEVAIHEVPEFTGGVNGAEATVHRVLNFEGGVPGGESPIYKVLAFTGGVNGTTPATHEIATYKDEQAQVVQAMLQDKIDQASVNRKNTLPETGAKETTGLATLGAVGALLGLSALGKKKEDQ